MAEIRLSTGQVNISGYERINIREVQNDTVIVAFLVVPPPVPAVQNILFSNLNPVVHYVDFREAIDGISQGVLLATYVYDAATGTILAERRYYRGNGIGANDPAAPSFIITDPYLTGKNVTGVFKEGFRYLVPTTEWSFAIDTVTIIPPMTAIDDREVMSVEIQYSTVGSSPINKNFPRDIVEEIADFNIDNTHFENMVNIKGGTTILTGTMPDALTIADLTKISFNTDDGDQRYFALQFTGLSYVLVGGKQKDILWMGKGATLSMIFKAGIWRVINWSEDWQRVGECVKADMAPLNSVQELGSWENISDFPRLYNDYVSELPPGLLSTGTFAGGNPTDIYKWCIDEPAGKFWIPNTQGYFERLTDTVGLRDTSRAPGDRKPGTSQDDNIGEFIITLRHGNSYNGNPNSAIFGNGGASPQDFNYTFHNGQETRPININRNSYRII